MRSGGGVRSASPAALAAMPLLWLCWGSSFPAIRVMVRAFPPLLSCGIVFLAAGAVLGLRRPATLPALRAAHLRTAAGVGCCLLGAQGAVAVAEQHVYASVAALLVA